MSKQSNIGGNTPFGYKWLDGVLVQEPSEAPTYALIFDLFIIHQRKRKVAKLLNDSGLRTRAGKLFSFATVSRMLSNPIAKGLHRSSTSNHNANGQQKHIVTELSVQPIVTTAIWDHVQSIISEQAGSQRRSATQDVYIGKVTCSCESLMELPSKSSEYRCHQCDQRASKQGVSDSVENVFSNLSPPPKSQLESLAKTTLINTGTNLSSTLKQIERDIEKLFDLFNQDAITPETFNERNETLETRKAQIQARISAQPPSVNSDEFIDHWNALPFDMKRIVVENLIDKITVGQTQTTVSLYPLFNFAQQVTTTPS